MFSKPRDILLCFSGESKIWISCSMQWQHIVVSVPFYIIFLHSLLYTYIFPKTKKDPTSFGVMTNWFKKTTWDSCGIELWCHSVTLASAFIGIILIWFMPRASADCFLFTKVIAQRSFASKPLHRPLNQTHQLIMRQSVPAINYASVFTCVCVCVWVGKRATERWRQNHE